MIYWICSGNLIEVISMVLQSKCLRDLKSWKQMQINCLNGFIPTLWNKLEALPSSLITYKFVKDGNNIILKHWY
jgi:hypothetical protein